jgi:hypothetical protein
VARHERPASLLRKTRCALSVQTAQMASILLVNELPPGRRDRLPPCRNSQHSERGGRVEVVVRHDDFTSSN